MRYWIAPQGDLRLEIGVRKQFHRRHWLRVSISAVVAMSISSCGTLLYPERRGQPAGRLDWKVVLLDTLGLFIFFIPGVVAFAVDFLNGTIYLPQESVPCEPPCLPTSASKKTTSLEKISVPRRQLTPAGIEKIIAKRTGRKISLRDGRYVACKMESIDEFWKTKESLDGHSLSTLDPVS